MSSRYQWVIITRGKRPIKSAVPRPGLRGPTLISRLGRRIAAAPRRRRRSSPPPLVAAAAPCRSFSPLPRFASALSLPLSLSLSLSLYLSLFFSCVTGCEKAGMFSCFQSRCVEHDTLRAAEGCHATAGGGDCRQETSWQRRGARSFVAADPSTPTPLKR